MVIDSQNIADVTQDSLRSIIGVVPQDTVRLPWLWCCCVLVVCGGGVVWYVVVCGGLWRLWRRSRPNDVPLARLAGLAGRPPCSALSACRSSCLAMVTTAPFCARLLPPLLPDTKP